MSKALLSLAPLALILCGACQSASARPAAARSVQMEAGLAAGAETASSDFDVEIAQSAAIGDLSFSIDAAERLIVRTGALTLRTGNPEEVGRRAVSIVQEASGYVVQQRNDRYVFRVPAAAFPAVLEAIADLGAVVSRQIDAEDVTEQVRDLELRLKNARALRDRYAQLLGRAEKVEDVLAIEKELAKVTEEIERIETQLTNRRRDIAFSLLTLDLQPVRRGGTVRSQTPFPWIGRIGMERLPGYRPERASRSRVRWSLPPGFADMGRTEDDSIRGWAYSPDGIRLVVRRFDNRPEVRAGFWRKEISRELVKVRGYEIDERSEGDLLFFRSVVDGRPTSYALRLIVTEDNVTTVEVIGPDEAVEAHWQEIAGVIASVEERAR